MVRMRRPDFKGEKLWWSSGSRSTEERRWHSTSLRRRTGRPLLVTSALEKKLAISAKREWRGGGN